MRRSMRISIVMLFGLLAGGLLSAPALSHGRDHGGGDDRLVRIVNVDHKGHRHDRSYRGRRDHGHARGHRGHGSRVVIVKPYRHHGHRTKVIVHKAPPRRHRHHHGHDDPFARLIGQVLAGALSQTLENTRSRQTVVWNNPDDRSRVSVTPVRTFRNAAGQYCREYATSGTIGGYEEDLYGTACRMPDGSWRRVN